MAWIQSLQNEILFVNDMKGPGPGPINGLDFLINRPIRTYIITKKSTIEIKRSGARANRAASATLATVEGVDAPERV
jgi:hypothetical protein